MSKPEIGFYLLAGGVAITAGTSLMTTFTNYNLPAGSAQPATDYTHLFAAIALVIGLFLIWHKVA